MTDKIETIFQQQLKGFSDKCIFKSNFIQNISVKNYVKCNVRFLEPNQYIFPIHNCFLKIRKKYDELD